MFVSGSNREKKEGGAPIELFIPRIVSGRPTGGLSSTKNEDSVTVNTEVAITKHQTVVLFIFLGPVVECRI